MVLAPLPLDIVDALSAFLPTRDLLALALAHSTFYPFAQRYIYRHAAITSQPQAVRFLRTLRSHPALARHVRDFSLRLDQHAVLLRPFVELLASGLADMANLISLDLALPSAASSVLGHAAARGASYARLAELSCNSGLDEDACAFLSRTPSLKELQLGDGGSPGQGVMGVLPAGALPKLSLFMGSSEAATLLVPGRPLESVHLYSGELTEDVLLALACSASPITVFGALTYSLSPSVLQCLAVNLPNLHHVRIMTMYHSSSHPDEMFYTQVVRILSTLPELKTAELAGIRWASCKKDAKESASGSGAQARPPPAEAHAVLQEEPQDISESLYLGLY